MIDTPVSLLLQLRQAPSEEAWHQFVDLYADPLLRLMRRAGLGADDAADLVQEVFVVLAVQLPRFDYDQQKSFTAWLITVARNKCRDRLRRKRGQPALRLLADVREPAAEDDSLTERDFRQHLIRCALQLLETKFPPETTLACRRCWLEGRSVPEVARELGISVNAVNIRTCRAAARLRQLMEGLLD